MSHMLTGSEWNAEEGKAPRSGAKNYPSWAIEIARKIATAASPGVEATLASARQGLTGEAAGFGGAACVVC